MNIAFFGSPELAVITLNDLVNQNAHLIKLVVTQPDKPAGKHLTSTPTAAKTYAIKHSISFFDLDLNKNENIDILLQQIKEMRLELGILFAYSKLIPQKLLDSFPKGFWNIHPSLLPKYRGASPTIAPILAGDHETGVTIMQMVAKLDAGDILAQTKIPLNSLVKRTDIEPILAHEASNLLEQLLTNHENIKQVGQDESSATYTPKITRQDGYIPALFLNDALNGQKIKAEYMPHVIKRYFNTHHDILTHSGYTATIVDRMFRAFDPWPGIWTEIIHEGRKLRLKIVDCSINDDKKLTIKRVQLEGKKAVDFSTFLKAYKI